MRSHAPRRLLVATCLAAGASLATITGAAAAEPCPNEAFRSAQGASYLPQCRAYEMVSPPDKNGGNVIVASNRSRVSTDGDAISFQSLTAFGDAIGTGIAVSYVADRSSVADPGNNGWATHAITPSQSAIPPSQLLGGGFDPRYDGSFSPDLERGVFEAFSPVTENPYVRAVPNLYLRIDLRTPGSGAYQLISACPLCEAENVALPTPAPTAQGALKGKAYFGGASPDLTHIAFTSRQRLTVDTPPQPAGCNFETADSSALCRAHLYEWEEGVVRLAGILPKGGAADVSYVGSPMGEFAPHAVSDGTDGHTRVFFTQPTNESGQTSEEVATSEQARINEGEAGSGGNLFVRIDGRSTEQLNLSERTDCGITSYGETPKAPPACTGAATPTPFAQAHYLDATPDGARAFFLTTQSLTDETPLKAADHLYMWSASPDAEGHHLTLISRAEGTKYENSPAIGVIGLSRDGKYVYFATNGPLMSGAGQSVPAGSSNIYLWHHGAIKFISTIEAGDSYVANELLTGSSAAYREARVTPDGLHVLFSNFLHGNCPAPYSNESLCRNLYLYNAETDAVVCVSCPMGPLMASASDIVENGVGGSKYSGPLNNSHALSDDGRFAFFSTAEALVPQDTNGIEDAYEYDSVTGKVYLLSSGESRFRSWFVDATPDGTNAFFVTAQRLAGWDVDNAYDMYDARVGGGFPEPLPPPPSCQGDACQPAPVELFDQTPASVSFAERLATAPAPTVVKSHKHKAKQKRKNKRKKRSGNSRASLHMPRRSVRK